jgi:hypothetical protein
MKLRLQANSIRLRLKRGEVAQLIARGFVEETISFGSDQTLSYRLQISTKLTEPRAVFATGKIEVTVPVETASNWASGNDVGIEANQPAGELPLQILIEKDFACLNGPEEQNVDTFPNPLAGTRC